MPREGGAFPPAGHLLGRDREVLALEALLRDLSTRLVTIIGPGGVGKTALASHLLARVAPDFPDGTACAQLAPVRDESLVMLTIAHALDVREQPGVGIAERLADVLRGKRFLLFLDNLEHLPGAASEIAELIEAAPGLTVLVSSRAPLNIRAEQRFPLGTLDTHGIRPDQTSPAAELFAERARRVRPDFALTASNAADVASICAALDGLPLAIELAAARVALLPVATLRLRLSSQLRLLTGGPADLPPRLRSMADAIRWSYDSLSPVEQAVCRRLSVFLGGWTLEAAEEISAGEPVARDSVLPALSSLLDKSLVRRIDNEGDPAARYSMLETVREFGLAELGARGESEQTRAAHLAYFFEFARRAGPALDSGEQAAWLSLVDRENDNIRAAIGEAVVRQDAERALGFIGAMRRFWDTRDYMTEGRQYASEALALPDSEGLKRLWASAHAAAGELAMWQNDEEAARLHNESALAAWRELGEPALVADALFGLAGAALLRDDLDAAMAHLGELDAEVAGGNESARTMALYARAVLSQATHAYEPALSCFRELNERWSSEGDLSNTAVALAAMGELEWLRGNGEASEAYWKQMLPIAYKIGEEWDVAWYLEGIAALRGQSGDHALAARLLGAADAWRRDHQAPPLRSGTMGDLPYRLTRDAMGEAFEVEFAAGQSLTLEDAVALTSAASRPRARAASPTSADAMHGLTPREAEIAALLARRFTDREIAEALVISPRTVTTHVAAILGKLGVASRRDVAAVLGEPP